jgi:Glycosyltransferase family 87
MRDPGIVAVRPGLEYRLGKFVAAPRAGSFASLMQLPNLKRVGLLYLASILFLHALVLWNARSLILKGYPDFTIYYTAGTMVRQGLGPSLYDDVMQFKVQQQFAPDVATRLAALPFNHPPFETILFLPFTYLSYRAAFLLWGAANLAMLAALPNLLRPHVLMLQSWPAPVWTLLSLAFFPIFFALLQGQDAILLLFLYALVFVSLKRGRLISAGAWLACGLFKFHLVLPFLFLLLLVRGKRKVLQGFLPVAAILACLSLATVGVRPLIAYPRYVLGLEATMARGAIMPSDMPNLRGLLHLMAAHAPHFESLVVVLSLVLFVLAAWISYSPGDENSGRTDDLKFSLVLLATVLVSYHGLGYDLCVLMLPILLLVGHLKTEAGPLPWTRVLLIAGLVILFFSPLQIVLLMRYSRLALLGWAVLLCFVGAAGELQLPTRKALQTPVTESQ